MFKKISKLEIAIIIALALVAFYIGLVFSSAYQSVLKNLPPEQDGIMLTDYGKIFSEINSHPFKVIIFNGSSIRAAMIMLLIAGVVYAYFKYNQVARERQRKVEREYYEAQDGVPPMQEYYPNQHMPYGPSQPGAGNDGDGSSKAEEEDKTPDVEVVKFSGEGPSALNRLNGLIGLETVKNEVNSLINFIKIQTMRVQQGLTDSVLSNHMVFTGNPGTGKTTVGRYISQALFEIGMLSKGHLVEVDRSHLVAEFVGQTAPLVRNVVKKAMGGVLFIDEAYTLTSGSKGDYGAEAIATLLKCMEDSRSNLIVIVAGYKDLMEEFVNSNPGLRSRFNRYIDFPDYTPYELLEIFQLFCSQQGYFCEESLFPKLYDYFQKAVAEADETFANGRFARNTFETILVNQANRLSSIPLPSPTDLSEIKEADFVG